MPLAIELRINAARLCHDLDALAQIGGTDDGGVTRTAMSALDVAGRAWFRQRVLSDGLRYCEDGAGNQSAVWPSADANAKTLLAGSHLDTVPGGGRFDGALGVLAALEALRTVRDANLALPVHLEALNFTDEEGSVLSMIGSLAATGQLPEAELAHGRGGPQALDEGLARIGINRRSVLGARREVSTLAGYVELHIEQGTRLEEAEAAIGVVTAIVGIRSFWLRFVGAAAHAGTTPMHKRADALLGTAQFALQAHEAVQQRFAPGVMNCGQIEVKPGAFNIVPAEARLALEFRHQTEQELEGMQAALLSLADEVATEHGLTLEVHPLGQHVAAQMGERVVSAIEQASDGLGLKHLRLISYAGHDAQNLSAVTPSAMIFVPSVNGISHNPQELTRHEDVVNGANVLLQTLLALM